MFSHIHLGTAHFEQAFGFYEAIADELGLVLRFKEPDRPWAGWQQPGHDRPLLIIGRPFDGQPHAPGNGQMVAFLAATQEQVRRVHAAALAQGGTCEGPPGPRPEYHGHYYGAYFRDVDGNKLAVACHAPQAEASGAAFDAS